MEDGTAIVASGDHRFLTDRGWKHVTGTTAGRDRRPHLTPHDELLGFGRSAQSSDRQSGGIARGLASPTEIRATTGLLGDESVGFPAGSLPITGPERPARPAAPGAAPEQLSLC